VDSPEYDCQFVLATNEAAVLNAVCGSTLSMPRFSGSHFCTRCIR
jgi:hypothetical protein